MWHMYSLWASLQCQLCSEYPHKYPRQWKSPFAPEPAAPWSGPRCRAWLRSRPLARSPPAPQAQQTPPGAPPPAWSSPPCRSPVPEETKGERREGKRTAMMVVVVPRDVRRRHHFASLGTPDVQACTAFAGSVYCGASELPLTRRRCLPCPCALCLAHLLRPLVAHLRHDVLQRGLGDHEPSVAAPGRKHVPAALQAKKRQDTWQVVKDTLPCRGFRSKKSLHIQL